MSLDELQRALEVSIANASPLSRRIYANDRWSAGTVEQFINRVMAATIATARADGSPHAAVVLTACMDGTVYLTASAGSLVLRNLESRPALAMTVVDRDHDVTIHGHAESLGKAAEQPKLVNDLHAISRRGQFVPRDWDGYLFAVRIDRIFVSR